MTNENKKWVALIVIGIIAISAFVMGYKSLNRGFGNAGDIHSTIEKFTKGFLIGSTAQLEVDNTGALTTGGAALASTSSGTVTLVNTDLAANHQFDITPAIGTVTLTLPTRANIGLLNPLFIPTSVDTITKWVTNATTSSSLVVGVLRIVGNTGVIVRNISTSTGGDLIYAGQQARLDFRRSATTTDITVDVTIFK